jgi:heat shock protein HslJ
LFSLDGADGVRLIESRGRFGCSFLDRLETMMKNLRRCAAGLVCLVLAGSTMPVLATDSAFPFGSELSLDAAPPPGTKRVPTIEIDEDGAAAFDLWCARVSGSAKVSDDAITITPTKTLSAQCSPERLTQDAALLAALSQVTNWRRNGDVIEFLGATPLRFRLMTN